MWTSTLTTDTVKTFLSLPPPLSEGVVEVGRITVIQNHNNAGKVQNGTLKGAFFLSFSIMLK